MTTINIIDKAVDELLWKVKGSSFEYSNHMYRNSPYESANSCGNCNGSGCDTCYKIVTPSHLEFSVPSDTLYTWILETGVPEDIASSLAYSDSCNNTCKGYRLIWPNASMLKESYPELYTKMTTPDPKVIEVIKSFKGQFDCFAYLRDAVLSHYDIKGGDQYRGHIPNQLEIYWIACEGKHDIACK